MVTVLKWFVISRRPHIAAVLPLNPALDRMRFRRRKNGPFTFGIRPLLGMVAFSAIAAWWGAFAALLALACTAAHYIALSAVWIFIARINAVPSTAPYSNWQYLTPDDGLTLRIATTIYLVFHYVWHLFWLMVMLPIGRATIWHTPTLGPLTLAHIEHLCLAAFSLLLITSFLSRAYAGEHCSRRICTETSTLLTFLFATHFAIP